MRSGRRTPGLLQELIGALRGSGIRVYNGQRFMATTAVSSAFYTVLENDCLILADGTSNTVAITLPSAALHKNRILSFKRIQSGGNNITITRAGSDTIEGSTSITLSAQYDSRLLVSDGGTLWYLLSTT